MRLNISSRVLFGLATIPLSSFPVPSAAQVPLKVNYRVAQRIQIDSGHADYMAIDVVNRRLYGFANRIIDIDNFTVAGQFPPHSGNGFAIATELGRGLTRAGVVFDLKTGSILQHLDVKGDAVAYDPTSHHVLLIDDTVTVVNLAEGRVVSSFQLDGGPEGEASDTNGHVFINLWQKDSLAVVDARSARVIAEWPLQPCEHPLALALDRSNHRLFVSCALQILVLDATTGRHVASIAVPGRSDQMAFDEQNRVLFAPDGGGAITMIHEDSPDRFSIVGSVSVIPDGVRIKADDADKVVYDAVTHRIFSYYASGTGLTIAMLTRDR